MTRLTKTEKFMLNEVDSCPDKTASLGSLRSACPLTPQGFRRLTVKMTESNLLAWADHADLGSALTLTFGGMMAMRANGMEVAQ